VEPCNSKKTVSSVTSLNNIDARLYQVTRKGSGKNSQKKSDKVCVPSQKFVESLLQVNKVGTITNVHSNISSLENFDQGRNVMNRNRPFLPLTTHPKAILQSKLPPSDDHGHAEIRVQLNPTSPKRKTSKNRIPNKESLGSDGKSSIR
jgi:hypothetical protein